MRSIQKTALLVLAALAASRPALAFGPMEHKAIAIAAEYRLSARALYALRQILGPITRLERIAGCADELLHAQGDYDCGGLFKVASDPAKRTQPWHYINIPVGGSVTAESLDSHCPNGRDCVVEQIRRQAAVLGDPASATQDRRVALMMLVHLVADEHQPLHCADDDDKGGNKKPVTILGKPRNLHGLWDHSIMPEDWREQAKMDPGELVAGLERDLDRFNAKEWLRGDYVAGAAVESFAIAKTVVYPAYAEDHGRDLGEAYQRRMQPVAKRRMEMAAVRLADILEKALGQDKLHPDARMLEVAHE